jgi:hypothetical protein
MLAYLKTRVVKITFDGYQEVKLLAHTVISACPDARIDKRQDTRQFPPGLLPHFSGERNKEVLSSFYMPANYVPATWKERALCRSSMYKDTTRSNNESPDHALVA